MRRGLALGAVLGSLNGGLGVVLAWRLGRQPGAFGWYSYSPMPRRYADYLPVSSTPGWQIAIVVVAAFLVVNMAAAAVIYGRRGSR